MVEDNYIEKENMTTEDGLTKMYVGAPSEKYKIYSKRLSRWVFLHNDGNNGYTKNQSEEAQEILYLTRNLYNKYLNDII